MKYIAILLAMLIVQTTNAASIKFYDNATESEVEFTVIPTMSIERFEYNEGDKELTVWLKGSKFQDFKVESLKQANEIILKILDTKDNSFVSLIKS